MIKFRWDTCRKRLVAYTVGRCTLLESMGREALWTAEYVIVHHTGDLRKPYRYEPYLG